MSNENAFLICDFPLPNLGISDFVKENVKNFEYFSLIQVVLTGKMALYMKQDFSPPLLSPRWFAMKFRPNILLHTRAHITTILESGLLFREDCADIEQEAPAPETARAAAGVRAGWATQGEAALSAAGVGLCVWACPPKSLSRTTLLHVAAYITIPIAIRMTHRSMYRAPLQRLVSNMQTYLSTARRAAAMLKELSTFCTQIGTLTSILESTHTLLCRQQSELLVLMSRASSALLGNAPWIHDDVVWDAHSIDTGDNLQQIHHAFMVVQSTLLKHIAMAHFIPSPHLQKLYKNHNERLYWIHSVLINHLNDEFQQNLETLQRMYRVLKHSTTRSNDFERKKNTTVKDSWIFSDVQTGVARAALELKLALDKSNSLDILLDSCAINGQIVDIDVLDKDIENVIEIITKSLVSIQNSQLRLKNLKSKIQEPVLKEVEEGTDFLEPIEQLNVETDHEVRDEVFYFVKTDEDSMVQSPSDIITGPGLKEKETTKIVINELKRKLGKREDLMRERERQALVKTMPDLEKIPEFPRQIQFDEFLTKKGFITKIRKEKNRKKFFRHLIGRTQIKNKRYDFKMADYVNEDFIKDVIYEANAFLNAKSRLISVSCENGSLIVTKWSKTKPESKYINFKHHIDPLPGPANINNIENNNTIQIKFTKKDLELSGTSSDSELENQRVLLEDVRRHRVVRKKNYPSHRVVPSIDNADESLKPVEYSLGAGLAMASVLQGSNRQFLREEEVFIGDGEVSEDSGNDEDA